MSTTVSSPASGAALLESIAAANPALHSHLTALISHLIQHRPSDPFQSLEKLSSQLLSSPTSSPDPLLTHTPALTAYLTSSPYLLIKQPPPPPASPDDEPVSEEDAPPPPAFLPDLASLTSLLREAGLSLSDEESVLIDRAACHLTTLHSLDSLRFWGKLLTTSTSDYYIFEAKKSSYDDDEAREDLARQAAIAAGTPPDVYARRELLGAGANEYLYFVTQTLHTPAPTFTTLPSTTPRFIADARATHRLLTGRLDAAVGGFPRFPGVEADLVRAQVARITQGTVMVPRGSWKEEEGEVVIENEEWKGPLTGQILLWTHGRGHLRREGRVEPAPEEEPEGDGEDGEAKAAVKAEVELRKPLLAVADQDFFTMRVNVGLDGGGPGKAGGEEGEGEKAISGLVRSIWSTVWPGSVSVVRGKEYASVYVGWGLKAGKGAGRVDRLAAMEAEWEGELVEGEEVKATEEEEKKEREEEEEKKKEEGGEKKAEDEEEDDLPADEEDKKEEED